MIILAKQTIEGAGLKKNRQILKPGLGPAALGIFGITGTGSARADPIGNAIRRQKIMVPGKPAAVRRNPSQAPLPITAQAAVARLSLCHATAVHTDIAGNTPGAIRWDGWQPEFHPALPVGPGGNLQCLLRLSANTCRTNTQDAGDVC